MSHQRKSVLVPTFVSLVARFSCGILIGFDPVLSKLISICDSFFFVSAYLAEDAMVLGDSLLPPAANELANCECDMSVRYKAIIQDLWFRQLAPWSKRVSRQVSIIP